MTKAFLILTLCLSACGKAEFSADTEPAPDIAVSIVTTGVDFYIETKQEFSNEIAGEVELSTVTFFGTAVWPALSTLQLELRVSLMGSTSVGEISAGLAKPVGWDSALPVLSTTVPAGSTAFRLQSVNLKDSVSPILQKGEFWIQGRLRYGGIDLGRTLTLKSVFVHADGQKNLGAFSPLLNLGF